MKTKINKIYYIILALSIIFSFSHCSKSDELKISGSDTMVNMVAKLKEEFNKENPNVAIAVSGGGSGVGIAALKSKEVTLCNASREMKEDEWKDTKEAGIDVKEIIVAIDGLAVIIHKENPVDALTVDQIGAIFRGEITNWQDVGGVNSQITLHGRQSSSGTYEFFRSHVLKGDYSEEVKKQSGNSAIAQNVSKNQNAIGYIGAGYVEQAGDSIKPVKVKVDPSAEAFSPMDSEAVLGGDYPLTRPLFMYSSGVPKGSAKQFIDFILSEKGQKVVSELGFYPLSSKEIKNQKTKLQQALK